MRVLGPDAGTGWAWVYRESTGEEGWVPASCVGAAAAEKMHVASSGYEAEYEDALTVVAGEELVVAASTVPPRHRARGRRERASPGS